MKEIIEKSVKGATAFTGMAAGIYITADCNKDLIIKFIFICGILSLAGLYTWYSFHALKNREKLMEINLELNEKIKKNENKLNKLNENNQGLIEERIEYQRKIEYKDNKISQLEKEVIELKMRVICSERGNNCEL